MYTIYDIMKYINFGLISENIEIEKAFSDNQPIIIELLEFKDGELIFSYSPRLNEKYPKKYNLDAVTVIVNEILEDVAREYYEQTSLIHAVELGERKFKNKRE